MIKSPYATRFTVYGERNMDNNKPYRTAAGKRVAASMAEKIGGRWVSKAAFKLHNETLFKPNKAQLRHAARYYRACGQEALAVNAEQEMSKLRN